MLLFTLLVALARGADCDDTGADASDTGFAALDCDGDGTSRGDGDCNDTDPAVFPGALEVCGDSEDNDCNGLFDDGCEDPLKRGSLQGGASCGGSGAWVVLCLPWWRRR